MSCRVCARTKRSEFASNRLTSRRLPVLLLLVSLGVAVESPFEIAEPDDEAGPPVNEAKFEDVVLEERPKAVTECSRHRDALVGKLLHAEGGGGVSFFY